MPMLDVEAQLRRYGDALDARLAEPPDVQPPNQRSHAVLVGAALVVLVVVIAAILVARSSDDTDNVVVDQPAHATELTQGAEVPDQGHVRIDMLAAIFVVQHLGRGE